MTKNKNNGHIIFRIYYAWGCGLGERVQGETKGLIERLLCNISPLGLTSLPRAVLISIEYWSINLPSFSTGTWHLGHGFVVLLIVSLDASSHRACRAACSSTPYPCKGGGDEQNAAQAENRTRGCFFQFDPSMQIMRRADITSTWPEEKFPKKQPC